MVTVEVYQYAKDGELMEDFVVRERDHLYALDESRDELQRREIARRSALGHFIPLPIEGYMDDDAVLIATYSFTEEDLNANYPRH